MSDLVLLSIVVISKDDPEGLRRTLSSIAGQTFRDHETIVVAKGGSEAVDAPGFGLPRLHWRRQAATGISAAFNEGIGCASGAWVNFLNGGDAYRDASVLDRMRAFLMRGERIVTARAACPAIGIRIPRDRSFSARDLELVAHQATFFRRDLFLQHGLYSAEYRVRMDFEWMLRLPSFTPASWVDEDIVEFEAGGVSNADPLRNCLEEFRALRAHGRSPLRLARLLALYLPMRLSRHTWRKLSGGARRPAQDHG